MKTATAIKKFMDVPGFNPDMNYEKASAKEIKEFKDTCSEVEWKEFGRQACEVLGETFEE